MKNLCYFLIIGLIIFSCGSSNKTTVKNNDNLPEGACIILI